ncbi:UbiA-like protein EboC [Brevibacillus laterosporus]|uniref:UbiA-like protein EboC n=1 Tax=Brevibacillus laterosporus TaxID=1465 RepID=UPI003D241763
MRKIRTYFELIRFPNTFTAMADILAGIWIAGVALDQSHFIQIILLIFASACIYATGIILNDIFDFEIDKKERPERPLTSGRISLRSALRFGLVLLTAGIVSVSFVSKISFLIACILIVLVFVYNRYSKHHDVFGPLTMGICRGVNLLLGLSVAPDKLAQFWWIAGLGFLYIFTVTVMSKGEVGNGIHPNRVRIMAGAVLTCAIVILFLQFDRTWGATVTAVIFFLLWTFSGIIPALAKPTSPNIRKAVGTCILGLPLLDGAVAASFGGWPAFFSVSSFLILSYIMSRIFPVT